MACFCDVEGIGLHNSRESFVTRGSGAQGPRDVPGYGKDQFVTVGLQKDAMTLFTPASLLKAFWFCRGTAAWVLHTPGICGHYLYTERDNWGGKHWVHPRAPAVPALMSSHPKGDGATGVTGEESSQWVFTNWFPVAHFQQIVFPLKNFHTAIKWQTKPISKGKQLGWRTCPAKEGCKHTPQAVKRNEPFLRLRDTNPRARFHPACSPSNKPPQ